MQAHRAAWNGLVACLVYLFRLSRVQQDSCDGQLQGLVFKGKTLRFRQMLRLL
jgi:hypothetical protein